MLSSMFARNCSLLIFRAPLPLIPKRLLSTSLCVWGKTTPQFYNLTHPPASADGTSKPEEIIVDAYRAQVRNEYNFLKRISPKQDFTGAYTQLPEDSQFIEQHYKELKLFKQYLTSKYEKTFSDFKSEELLKKLYNFIDESLNGSKVEVNNEQALSIGLNVESIYIVVDNEKIPAKYFLRFLIDVKITLNLNSNHTFILDTLLQNKEIFDQVDRQIANKKK